MDPLSVCRNLCSSSPSTHLVFPVASKTLLKQRLRKNFFFLSLFFATYLSSEVEVNHLTVFNKGTVLGNFETLDRGSGSTVPDFEVTITFNAALNVLVRQLSLSQQASPCADISKSLLAWLHASESHIYFCLNLMIHAGLVSA